VGPDAQERERGVTLGAAAFVLACAVAGEDAAPTLVSRGDLHYARRGTADPGPIEAALFSYRGALAADAASDEAVWKLLRALHFRAAFTGASPDLQKALYDEATRVGQAAVTRLGKTNTPHGAHVHYWAAVAWGQWGLLRGKLSAARKGVAGKVRDLSQRVIDTAPQIEEGGGHRILGRLHDQAPRIPFLTGWVSRRSAVSLLRRSHAIGPDNPVTWFFLAEALLEHEPAARPEALDLLERCATTPPRPEYLVEEAHYAALARARLQTERRR
jgi:hypothetical protein